MQPMKGATMALGGMNRTMNLPSLQRIAMEFERENDIMEQRQEMMDDAIDDAMDVGVEEEGDEVVEQVLEEIGVNLNQAVSWRTRCRYHASAIRLTRTETARRCTAGSAGGCGIRGKGCPGNWGRERGRRSRRRRSPGAAGQFAAVRRYQMRRADTVV